MLPGMDMPGEERPESPAPSLRELRETARRLMREGRFQDATPLWRGIAERAPKDVEPRMALARIHLRGDRPLEALDLLAEVLREKPEHAEAQRLRANIAHTQISRLANQIGSHDPVQMEVRFQALELRLGDDPYLRRVRSYGSLLVEAERKPEPRREAAPPPARGVEESALAFLNKLSAGGDIAAIRREGFALMRENVWLAHALSAFFAERGDLKEAVEVYQSVAAEEAEFWLEAARRAAAWRAFDAASLFAARAASCRDLDRAALGGTAGKLVAMGAVEAALALWRGLPDYRNDLSAGLEAIRILADTEQPEALAKEFHRLIEDSPAFGTLGESEMRAFAAALKLLRRTAARLRMEHAIAPLYAAAKDDGSAAASWVLGALAGARIDHDAAAAHFEGAKARGALFESLRIDLDGETALLHARFHEYGRAFAAMRRMGTQQGDYVARLKRVRDVAEFCGRADDLLYPECLIDTIFEEIAQARLGYAPEPGCLLTVSSSLRQGGSERQTVTLLSRLAHDPRVARAILALRSTESEDRAPFLRRARELPIALTFYGQDWQRNSDPAAELAGLQGRARLIAALDLLPRNLREDIVRLSRMILDLRPQAVHLRQDLFAAGIACALTGVPRFAIHRGSLSPDLWGHGALETNLHLRPMRHTYRKLLALPEFSIVNNSAAGAETDRAWTQWPDATRFRVIHNAVEFDKLGRDISRNQVLREKLGLTADGFLIGGVFRVTAVKRPMLWIEVARLVAQARPETHFVILGDGEIAAPMRAYARAHGFGHRLHMPGLVGDVGPWYRAMDVNLLTSDREGLPNVLIEGQHAGVPAVSSDVGGAFETVERDVTGFLIPPDAGAEAYAGAILRILSDAAWRERARCHAPAFVHDKFGMERAADAVLDALGMG